MQALCHCLWSHNMTEWKMLQEVCDVSYRLVFPIILLMAMATNMINVAVLVRPHPPGRSGAATTTTLTYLLWLALFHCAICFTVIVSLSVRRRMGLTYAWAFYFAHVEEPLYNVFNCSCAYIILGVSTDRYQAVCRPHKYSTTQAYHRMVGRVAVAYALPVFMYLPSCFSQAPQYSDHHKGWLVAQGAIFHTHAWRIWSVSLEVLHRILPSILLVILNLQILLAVLRLKWSNVLVHRRLVSSVSNREQQIIYLLLALTLAFLVTNLPATCLKLVYLVQEKHCHTNVILEVGRTIANCIEMAGVCCDFFLYFLMNPQYRQSLYSLVLCVRCGCCTSFVTRRPLQNPPDQSPTHS